jgi:hypothetical protein
MTASRLRQMQLAMAQESTAEWVVTPSRSNLEYTIQIYTIQIQFRIHYPDPI